MTKRINKFEAAARFDAGFRFAVCRGTERPDFDNELFMDGYHYGKTVKDKFNEARNAALTMHGVEPIGTIHLCETQKPKGK